MPPQIDHMILSGNDRAKSVGFYTRVLGFAYEGQRERTPFSVIRVTPGFILQLAPFGTTGNEHLAFSMSSVEFDQVFQRVRDHAIEYADSFDRVRRYARPRRVRRCKRSMAGRVFLRSEPAPHRDRLLSMMMLFDHESHFHDAE